MCGYIVLQKNLANYRFIPNKSQQYIFDIDMLDTLISLTVIA
jgi:hypothetical protein